MTTPPAIPPGSWTRDPSHYPVPLTPLYIDFYIAEEIPAGMRTAAEAFSSVLPTRSAIVVDGWEYVGTLAGVDHSPERVAAFEAKVRDRYEATVLERWHADIRPAALARLQGLQSVDRAALSDAELLAHVEELSACGRDCLGTHFTNGMAASVLHGRLGLFCQEHLGLTPAEVLQLLAGFSDATREPAARLEEIAARVCADPDLRAALNAPDAWSDPRVRDVLAPWLAAYGYRSTAFEYVVPTLVEQPEQVVQLLRDAVARHETGVPPADDRVREQREATIAALRARLPDEGQRATFDGLLADAQAAYRVRDDDVSFGQWAKGLQRHALLEAGRRLVRRGLLDDPEQVWYLRRGEVVAALEGHPDVDLRERVAVRRAEHERQYSTVPPVSLGTPPSPPSLPPLSDAALAWLRAAGWTRPFIFTPPPEEEAPGYTLRGAPASRGVYRGPARVVLGEDEFDRVQPGDVLVCPMTTPSWNILFGSVGALVTNEGGLLSHPAIIAREFGIPAVVGTHRATTSIKDGTIVEVDGSAGVVRW